jgi:hypothetical protein
VGTAEALSWAVALGVVVAVARVLAIRAASGRIRRSVDKTDKSAVS